MNFKLLEKNRYISDGDKDTVVIPNFQNEYIGNLYNRQLKTY